MIYMDWFANQKCVYWPPQSIESGTPPKFDRYGQPILSVASAVEMDCRWSKKTEEYLDATGTRVLSNAVVLVTQDVEEGGVLMLGELTDIVDAVNIKENPDAWEIKRFDKIPDVEAEEFLGKAFL